MALLPLAPCLNVARKAVAYDASDRPMWTKRAKTVLVNHPYRAPPRPPFPFGKRGPRSACKLNGSPVRLVERQYNARGR